MPTSSGRVTTETPERFAKQLCEHLGRRSGSEYSEGTGRITLSAGEVRLRSEPGVLLIEAEADGEEGLATVRDVTQRHLERFGQRTKLQVEWLD